MTTKFPRVPPCAGQNVDGGVNDRLKYINITEAVLQTGCYLAGMLSTSFCPVIARFITVSWSHR
jgi:hypothetical protein